MHRLERRAHGSDVLGVPVDRRAADGDRVRRRADERGQVRAVRAVEADHGERVVDGAPPVDPVAAEAGCLRHRRADAGRLELAPGGVHGSGEQIAEQVCVAAEGRDVGQAADRRAAREARGAVVVARVHGHRGGRDSRLPLDELAHRRRQLGPDEDEVGRDDRRRPVAVRQHDRLGDQRFRRPLRHRRPRRPAADRHAERRRDVDPVHGRLQAQSKSSLLTSRPTTATLSP